MPARLRPIRTHAHRRLVAALALGVVIAAGLTLGTGTMSTPGAGPVTLTSDISLAAQPPGPTRVRVSTFNLLGYGHTMPGGDRSGWLDGVTRQKMADQLIRANGLEVIGFQEMEQPQLDQFNADLGSAYDLFPGNTYKGPATVNVRGNSIAWRRDRWTALQRSYYDAPYFNGTNVPRPVVLLQNRVTGQQVLVTNTHNPANTKGDAQTWRDQSVDIQARTLNGLHAAHPGVPIIFTGDMNDTRRFYCRITGRTPLRAANGGIRTARSCTLPPAPQIDWIISTTDVAWSGYQQLRTPYVKKTTDHPLVWADATIRPIAAQRAGISRVVVVDIEGLPSAAISSAHARYAPHLRRLAAAGAATLNARTDPTTTAALPNLVSLLSGRPVARAYGGHGVTWLKDQPGRKGRSTIREGSGRYVPTLFDTVHDWGGSTSFMSSDPSGALVRRSYDAAHGAADRQGVSYGKAKLSVSSVRSSDSSVVRVLRAQLRANPRRVSVVQLSSLRVAGQQHGFLSPAYLRTLRQVDAEVGAIRASIARSPRLARSTLLVVTADSGGHGRSAVSQSLSGFQVPLIVWGHGVPGATDLYALNPAYGWPGIRQVGYAGRQPIRPHDVANLVTGVLGYPAVSGSRTRTTQDFNVFVTR
ncbi:hypothetical protein JCM18899A_16620 [Nocardioides sp. AN3]